MMRSRFLRLLTTLIALPFTGCRLLLQKPTRPVRKLIFRPSDGEAKETIVLLPGRLSPPEEFVQYGVVKEIQSRRPHAEIIVPDLHLGYYMAGLADVCLHDEILSSARSQKHKVTILGVSMGGLGALMYSLRYPGEVDELLLLSPFVGEEALITEIQAVGGLPKWESNVNIPRGKEQALRKCWGEIKRQWLPSGSSVRPTMKLAVGREDRLLRSNAYFAKEILRKGEFIELDGGHDWDCWLRCTQAVL